MATAFGRRQAMQAGALMAGGYIVGQVLRRNAPIGRDVGPAASSIDFEEGSPIDGPIGASLRLVVFSDYRCPACRRAYPAQAEAVRGDGDVLVVHKEWPIFGAASEKAASLALSCVEQGIYSAVHRRLMTDGRAIGDGMLREIVTSEGGDWKRATSWMATHDRSTAAQLRANARQAFAIGLTGTPGFLAGSLLVMGAIEVVDFKRLFSRARAHTEV
ncbi:DsbA family protein [Sphingomonas sp. RHCKR7]|uniref:DsbA family protein n=1 Tax=Sphingomonas folli TaxID=2862497 RepID=UPI001CA47D56|nr:DsbA family protein [Sphingomonas folli]MBW6528517.1 DsbA family protein [Sphingomonas folli]